jgi:hypothetical protein
MDRVVITCPSCKADLRVPSGRMGTVQCPKCSFAIKADTRPKEELRQDTTTEPSDWHGRLIKSLEDTGVTRLPLNKFSLLITPVVALALLSVPYSLCRDYINSLAGQNPSLVVLVLPVLFFFGPPAFLLERQIRRVLARSAQKAIFHNLKKPILYLRSFRHDEIASKDSLRQLLSSFFGVGRFGAEEVLVRSLRKLGPVIAIGHPKEEMPPLGAARFYVNDDKWQSKIIDIVSVAQLVVWVSGTTEGLRWELQHLLGSLPPERLILLPHSQLLGMKGAAGEEEWRAFLRDVGSLFPNPLPEKLGATELFYFGPGFKPIAVLPNEYRWVDTVASAGRILLHAKGLVRTPDWYWRSGNKALQLLWGCVAGVLADILVLLAVNLASVANSVSLAIPDFFYFIGNQMNLEGWFHRYVEPLFEFFQRNWIGISLSGLCGLVFVLILPFLRRSPTGYRLGTLLFGAAKFWIVFFIPAMTIAAITGDNGFVTSFWGYADRIGWWSALIVPSLWGIFWAFCTAMLIRLFPFGPARPQKPEE